MKKYLTLFILTYLLCTINSKALDQNTNTILKDNQKIIRIGVLIPLSGEFKEVGKSILNAIKLAIYDLGDENIIIYPRDTQGNAEGAFTAAKELENIGIKVVLGPIFHDSLGKLEEIEEIIFFSLTNKTHWLPKNSIALGINVNSQLYSIQKHLDKNKVTKTILLIPEAEYINQIKNIVESKKLKFYKILSYNSDPEKITAEIAKITSYNQRKINLSARKKKLQDSELEKDKKELEYLETKYTLGKVDFDSVIIADFGERLKSVLASFMFSDVSSQDVIFITLNQWFDITLFDEASMDNLYFPSIDYNNFKKFSEKYFNNFNEIAHEISILAYDGIGLISYVYNYDSSEIDLRRLYAKSGFKGLHGKFKIQNNLSHQDLNIYKISKKNFLKVN